MTPRLPLSGPHTCPRCRDLMRAAVIVMVGGLALMVALAVGG